MMNSKCYNEIIGKCSNELFDMIDEMDNREYRLPHSCTNLKLNATRDELLADKDDITLCFETLLSLVDRNSFTINFNYLENMLDSSRRMLSRSEYIMDETLEALDKSEVNFTGEEYQPSNDSFDIDGNSPDKLANITSRVSTMNKEAADEFKTESSSSFISITVGILFIITFLF